MNWASTLQIIADLDLEVIWRPRVMFSVVGIQADSGSCERKESGPLSQWEECQ